MKHLSLTKYGFIHNHCRDFSDDGTRFQVYELPGYPEIRATKASYNGEVFIDFTFNKNEFYNSCDTLNGVRRDVAEEKFQDVMNYVTNGWIKDCKKNYTDFVIKRISSINAELVQLNRKLNIYKDEVARIANL